MAKVLVVQTMDGEHHKAANVGISSAIEAARKLGREGAFFETDGGGIGFVPPHNIARIIQVEEEKLNRRALSFPFQMVQ